MRIGRIGMGGGAQNARRRTRGTPRDDWSRAATATIVVALAAFLAMIALFGPSPALAVAVILLAGIACLVNEPSTARPLAIAIVICLLAATLTTQPNLANAALAPMALIFCEGMVSVRRRLATAEHAANIDSLTGALTPRGFARMLASELPRARLDGRATALIFIDLDHFKAVNDQFGHAAGDDVLRRLVASLQSRLLCEDHIARVGGDEFLVFLRYADDPGRIEGFQTNMLGAVADLPYKLTASAGGLILPPADYPDTSALIHSADRLMYEMKNAGRGRIQFGHHGALKPGGKCGIPNPAAQRQARVRMPSGVAYENRARG